MGYSAKVKIDKGYTRKDGTCALFLQVIINRKKARIDLDISWPSEKFSEVDLCKPRSRKDTDVEEYNAIIGNARSKANNIHKDYLLRGLHITLESFLKDYNSNFNKTDFIEYFAQKSFDRWNKGAISDDTYEKEKGTLKKLKAFTPLLAFHEFTTDWAADFDRFLKRQYKNEANGRWNRHKHITFYLGMASRVDKLNFTDPYQRFKNQLQDGNWKPLELNQLQSLIEFYLKWRDNPLPMLHKKKDTRKGLSVSEVIVLRRFLFSCNTALRISDLQKLDITMFNNGEMTLTPSKTYRYGTKITSVPLNDVARMMLDDEIKDNPNNKVFDRYVDQSANKILKSIAIKMDWDFNLHNHVARYTFASVMDQAGANHTGLMKYMGLRKRDTLQKYVKTNSKVIAQDIGRMNSLLKTPSNSN